MDETGGRGKRRAAAKAIRKFVDSDSDDEAAAHSDASFKAEGLYHKACLCIVLILGAFSFQVSLVTCSLCYTGI